MLLKGVRQNSQPKKWVAVLKRLRTPALNGIEELSRVNAVVYYPAISSSLTIHLKSLV